jgi:hypothetical protein
MASWPVMPAAWMAAFLAAELVVAFDLLVMVFPS